MFIKLLVLATICLACFDISESVVLNRNQLAAWFPNIGLSPLNTVQCQSRSIKVIESDAFNNLRTYPDFVYLHNNQITHIHDNAFANATAIDKLWLNNNLMSSINESTFFGLTSLLA